MAIAFATNATTRLAATPLIYSLAPTKATCLICEKKDGGRGLTAESAMEEQSLIQWKLRTLGRRGTGARALRSCRQYIELDCRLLVAYVEEKTGHENKRVNQQNCTRPS